MPPITLVSVNFEVFGKVQGVFFRKYTLDEANKLGVRGWCKNTKSGTVQGVIEGESAAVDSMRRWLKYSGSPASDVEKAEFSPEKEIKNYTFDSFKIRR